MDHSTLRRVAAAAMLALTGLTVYLIGGAGTAQAGAANVRAEGMSRPQGAAEQAMWRASPDGDAHRGDAGQRTPTNAATDPDH